ncbi:Two component regulator propeller [Colwellia chukchiensis]|uniref:Two component regulator propeller n=1 Tax=Colwellia chukchiensis TaxID=641665 RepID=A0A1H7GXJ0_9GAMM|nr:two-component regulator propeller domain-containing protein [Colwellia chukchiensis]SEK41370.1 Two component regulator propeller [Colwellia chukchiensis]
MKIRQLVISLSIASTVFIAGAANATTTTYTTDADFSAGTLDSVNHDAPNNNQLQLNSTGDTFPVLWVANAGEDTMSRINTDGAGGNGCEEARYLTDFGLPTALDNHGAFSGAAPSRTAVDTTGNVYVANRNFTGARIPDLLKIAVEGGVDRNGNGVIDTSSDLNGDCMITPDEMLPVIDDGNGILDIADFHDERVIWVSKFGDPNDFGRSLCIDQDGDLWAGTYNGREYFQFDQAGTQLAGPIATGATNYGCAVDANGTLWGASLGSTLVELDTNTATHVTNRSLQSNYGIVLGNDRVYLGSTLHSYKPADGTTQFSVAFSGTGVAVDGDGAVWFGTPTLRKFVQNGGAGANAEDLNTTPACSVGTLGGRGPIVGKGGRIWTINTSSDSVSQYDSDCNFISTIPVGRDPYTYSDATGFGARNQTDPTGIWTVINDGGAADTAWDKIDWNNEPEGLIPAGSSITVEARSANSVADLSSQLYSAVTNGGAGLALMGQFIQVRATLRPGVDDASPILSDLTIHTTQDTDCDANADGQVDSIDIGIIGRHRNVPVPPGNPLFDINSDNVINVIDARLCVLQCTNDRCAIGVP